MFTIDTDNNIAAHAGAPANADNLKSFDSEKELAKLAADWRPPGWSRSGTASRESRPSMI
jgi:hypothetical protein